MKITFWGSRGSIPVSGRQYLKYGGDTTSIEIRTADNKIIIIDAGSGIRPLGNKLYKEKLYELNLILTHAHWDHVMGFPFFKPIYSPKTIINIYGCGFAQSSITGIVSKTLSAPSFPVDFSALSAKFTDYAACKRNFNIGSVAIERIYLNHPNHGLGYRFNEKGKSFVFLTDNELGHKHPGGMDYNDYVDFSKGANLFVHDSEYTDEEYKLRTGWGHSSYTDALSLACDAGVKSFGLFHHNQERPDKDVDGFVFDCKEKLKNKSSEIDCFAVSQGLEIEL